MQAITKTTIQDEENCEIKTHNQIRTTQHEIFSTFSIVSASLIMIGLIGLKFRNDAFTSDTLAIGPPSLFLAQIKDSSKHKSSATLYIKIVN